MGWVKQLENGDWQAFESEGSGAGRLQASAIREKKRDAQNAAAAMLTKKRADTSLEPHTLTLKAYLDRWTKHLNTLGRSQKSLVRYESICERLPASLSGTKLADLKPMQLQTWLDESGLAPATVRKQYSVIHAALTQAVAWRLLSDNPFDDVRRPKLPRTEMQALDEDQTAALLKSLSGTRYYAPALVAVTTGLRRGELLALRWQDVDLENAELRVSRSCDEVPGRPVQFKEPKTGKGRTVALMAATSSTLKAHKAAQTAERLAAKKWKDQGLVFPDRHGAAWRPSTFSVQWGRIVEHATRWHDLRHTHATQLLRAGVPVESVAKRLGHSTPVVTMTIYAHVLHDADSSAVAKMEESLGAALLA